jgi:hypothetical protein
MSVYGSAATFMPYGYGLGSNGSVHLELYYPYYAYGPSVLIHNWNTNRIYTQGAVVTFITNESGKKKYYSSTIEDDWLGPDEGAWISEERIKGHEMDVIGITISYPEGKNLLTDKWSFVIAPEDYAIFDLVHVVGRKVRIVDDKYWLLDGYNTIRFTEHYLRYTENYLASLPRTAR